MSAFITAAETNARFAEVYVALMDEMIGKINKVITEAREYPIAIPKSFLTDIGIVRDELWRKLLAAGWEASSDKYTTASGNYPDVRKDVFYLHNKTLSNYDAAVAHQNKLGEYR